MADDTYSKWGVDPNDLPGNPPDTQTVKGVSTEDFSNRWGLNSASPAALTEATPSAPFTWKDTWPVRIAKTIASGLTLPGDVYQGNATVPQSANMPGGEDISSLPRVNALAGIVGTGAMPTSVGAAASPLIDPATAQLAKLARDTYDIPLRGGQISESSPVRWLDAILANKPLSGYGANIADQQTSFNRAISNTIGENADKITPEVMDAAKTRLGQSYEDIAKQTTVKADDKLGSDFNSIATDVNSTLAPSERSIIHGQISNILDKIKGPGEIDGETYQSLIRTGSPLDRATKSSDSNVKFYAGKVKDALIDALNRSAPEDLQAQLKATNSQYKAMKTIEPLVEKSPTGDISPALLMGATRKSYGGMAYGGGGDLGDLSRIGQRFLKPLPSSGTSERLSAGRILGLGGLGLGEGAALYFHDPIMGAQVAALGMGGLLGKSAINAGAGSLLRSNWYANRLINSSLPERGSANMLDKLTHSQIPYVPPAALMPPMAQPQYAPQNYL